MQSALATRDDARAVAARWPGYPLPRRPWVQPLPANLGLSDLAADSVRLAPAAGEPGGAGAIAFGLLDLPHEQRRALAVWSPGRHGNLLVLGAPRSGKSTVLATLATGADSACADGAAAAVLWLPRAVPAAWDLLADLAVEVASTGGPDPAGIAVRRVLLVDDLDALVARVPPDHRTELLDRLAAVLREGPQHGISTVLAAQRVAGELQSVVGLAPARLMLRHASRQDWVLAGAEGTSFSDALPPGGGSWLGQRVQVATGAPVRPQDAASRRVALDPARPLAVISTRVASVTTQLANAGLTIVALASAPEPASVSGRVAVVGDVDDWQSRWGSIAALRPYTELVFDGCTPADLRLLTRSRDLPPPIERGEVWRLAADGSFERAVLPTRGGG